MQLRINEIAMPARPDNYRESHPRVIGSGGDARDEIKTINSFSLSFFVRESAIASRRRKECKEIFRINFRASPPE